MKPATAAGVLVNQMCIRDRDGVHGHAGLAHVTHHAGVVGVIAAVRRQVKGDGEALLAVSYTHLANALSIRPCMADRKAASRGRLEKSREMPSSG